MGVEGIDGAKPVCKLLLHVLQIVCGADAHAKHVYLVFKGENIRKIVNRRAVFAFHFARVPPREYPDELNIAIRKRKLFTTFAQIAVAHYPKFHIYSFTGGIRIRARFLLCRRAGDIIAHAFAKRSHKIR